MFDDEFCRGVHNRCVVMWDLVIIFVVIFRMLALKNRSGKWKFQIQVRAGFCVFSGSEWENREGKVVGYRTS